MTYFWGFLGWIWSKRKFILVSLVSAVLFFAYFFPFSDLSDLVTSAVSRATNNQVYLQFSSLDLNFVPSPAVSVREVSLETAAFAPLSASWMKFSPSWLSLALNAWTLKRAASGDPEASAKITTRLGANLAAEGLLGADVDLRLRPGSASDQGQERSKISLEVEKLNLGEFQKWSDLPVKLQGQADLSATVQLVPSLSEQPEGEISVKISKFNLPANTLMIPFEGAMMPVNLPTLTLANVILRGRLVGGKLIIEEGVFGSSKDPVSGRIKGQMGLKLVASGPQIFPQFGAYNLTVELNTTKAVEKEIGFAFLLFDSAKTPTPSGSHYLFQASGMGLGPPPTITRIPSF